MGLDDLAGFERAVIAFVLVWSALALLLAWPRQAPAAGLRWPLAALMAGLALAVQVQLAVQPSTLLVRGGSTLGVILCLLTGVRLAVVTDSAAAGWPLVSSRLVRALVLFIGWTVLAAAVWAAGRS